MVLWQLTLNQHKKFDHKTISQGKKKRGTSKLTKIKPILDRPRIVSKSLPQSYSYESQLLNHHERNLTRTQKLNICTKNWLISRVDEEALEVLPAGAVGPVAVVVAPGMARPFPGSEDLGAGIRPPGSAGEIGDTAGEKSDGSWSIAVGGSVTCGNW